MTPTKSKTSSPRWSSTTKLVVGLTTVAVLAALLIRFRVIIGPLLLAIILAYLFHPLAMALVKWLKTPWRLSVGLVYLLLLVLLLGGLTISGVALFQQLQSLINFVERTLRELPTLTTQLANEVYTIGPFTLDLSQFDLSTLTEQLLASIQPLLRQLTGLIGVIAGSAVRLFGWTAFVLLVSYFMLAESKGIPDRMLSVDIPVYNQDIRRLSQELTRIWNAFLRGQVLLTLFTIFPYLVVLSIFQVRFALPLSILAGLARFIPYVGPLVTYITTGLVVIFQGTTAFGLVPMGYVGAVLLTAIVVDQAFDNLVTPRIMGRALGVHPAGILIAAIIAANLLGFVGLLLAAPVLATVKLFGKYAYLKMLDMNPWPEEEAEPEPQTVPLWSRWWHSLTHWLGEISRKFRRPS
ncbi:MAG: AI-2E family transporter [Chloroflexota bacterium]